MRFWIKAVGVVALLASLTAACGDDDTTTDVAAPTDLMAGSLARPNEAPGLTPARASRVYPSLERYVDAFNLPTEEEERLKDHAYVATVELMLEGEESGGLSTVDLFETEKGAKAELNFLRDNKQKTLPDGVTVEKEFSIPGVPTAIGFEKKKPGSTSADVHWVQGRCLLTLASEPLNVDQLKVGVKAIYKRTGGRCP